MSNPVIRTFVPPPVAVPVAAEWAGTIGAALCRPFLRAASKRTARVARGTTLDAPTRAAHA